MSASDRALIAAMLYTFARVSAVLKLKVDDYYHNGARRRLRLHEKGGKEHEMPVHHLLEQILNEYIKAAGLQSGQRLPWIIVITDKVACFKPPPSVLGVAADSSLLPPGVL